MNIFVGSNPPAGKPGAVWFKDGVIPFVWDIDCWAPVDHRTMRTKLTFGIMLERVDGWWTDWGTERDPATPMWRVYSGKLHGPVEFTRRAAFYQWFKNWIHDFVRTSCRRMRG